LTPQLAVSIEEPEAGSDFSVPKEDAGGSFGERVHTITHPPRRTASYCTAEPMDSLFRKEPTKRALEY